MLKFGNILLAIGLSLMLLSGCSEISKNSNEIISFVEKENYRDARILLGDINNDKTISNEDKKEIISKVETKLSSEIDKLVEDFKNDEVSVKKINKTLNGYVQLDIEGLTRKAKKNLVSLEDLIGSREALINGEKYLKNKEYNYAIDEFSLVIKDDVKYKNAKNYIKEIKPKLLKIVKEEAVSIKENDSNRRAFIYLKDHLEYFKGNDSFETVMDKYQKAYYQESIQKVNEFRTKNDLDSAVKELETLKNDVNSTSEIEKLLVEIKGEQEKVKKERIEQLLASMDKHYDSMDDITRIAPKGIDPFELNIPKGSFIFFPMIQLSGQDMSKGIVAISVVAGFSQDDWIFMDRISFNVDGNRFNWELAFGEAETQVGWGSIYEWVFKNSLGDSNLKNDLQKIANGASVNIRFDGDTNSRDESLSNSQIQQIKDALELYDLLNTYGF